MGYAADMCFDKIINEQLDASELLENGYWELADESTILIKDMDNNHLINSYKKILRESGWRDEYKPILEKELKRRNLKIYK